MSAAHVRLSSVYVESLDWADIVRRYDRPHTLFFCDPPYYGLEGYGVDFGLEQYALMAKLAKTISGRMIITVNDCPEMREIFAGLFIQEAEIKYSCGNAAKAKRKSSTELIILNRPDGWGHDG